MIENRKLLEQEKILEFMINFYCKKNHHLKDSLCPQCKELSDYAIMRIRNCKYGNKKPNCNLCKVHCYKEEMREKIIRVMRYCGPRLLFYNPRLIISHIIDMVIFKNNNK